MIEIYRSNPKRFVKIAIIMGIILLLIYVCLRIDFVERASRTFSKTVEAESGKYIGDLNLGEVEGVGTFTWDNQNQYEGEFKNNELNGEGELVFANGSMHSGYYEDSKREGNGQFKWANGDEYYGAWSDDKITGEGRVTFVNGGSLEGYFEKGIFLSGEYKFENDQGSYTVTVKNCKISNVRIVYADESIFEGEYKNGTFDGEGHMLYKNGDEYTGSFVNGKKSGNGTYTWDDGSYYIGNWKNDKMDGKGTFYYQSKSKGYKLDGPFKNNRPDGVLDYYTDEDTCYETKWSKGKCIKLME